MLVIEAGDLEKQSLLLVESIREFAGRYRNCDIWVVQPRAGHLPSQSTLNALLKLKAYYLRADLNVLSAHADPSCRSRYGLMNKPYAAAFIETLVADKTETLVFMDSDTLVLQQPEELVLKPGEAVAIRPVDASNAGSLADQPPNAFWKKLYEICGVEPHQVWTIETSTHTNIIRAYFNSGQVAARPARGLFRRWKDNVEQFAKYEQDPDVAPTDVQRYYMEQATLAATILANTTRDEVHLLSKRYNYPLPWQAQLLDKNRVLSLNELVTIHYRHAFDTPGWRQIVDVGEPYRTWLEQRLPLHNYKQRLRSRWRGLARRIAGG